MTHSIVDDYGLAAPPEIVFGTLTDPVRLTRCLPDGLVAESVGHGRLLIRDHIAAIAGAVRSTSDDLSIEWAWPYWAGLAGTVQVRDAGAGASTVTAQVTLGRAGLDPASIRAWMATTADRLAQEVAENFTPG